jgi:hypothetical protein
MGLGDRRGDTASVTNGGLVVQGQGNHVSLGDGASLQMAREHLTRAGTINVPPSQYNRLINDVAVHLTRAFGLQLNLATMVAGEYIKPVSLETWAAGCPLRLQDGNPAHLSQLPWNHTHGSACGNGNGTSPNLDYRRRVIGSVR